MLGSHKFSPKCYYWNGSFIVVDEMHIAHIYKACGFNLRLLSLWLLFHWYISFLSKVSVGESQTHAKADNAMSRIGDYSISWWNEHFSLKFRLFARGFQMKRGISFHASNFSADKLKQKMVNKTRIAIQKIINGMRIRRSWGIARDYAKPSKPIPNKLLNIKITHSCSLKKRKLRQNK